MSPKKVLITGGSGLLGSRLTELLLEQGYEVAHLSRKAKTGVVPAFAWDVSAGSLDEKAFTGVDTIIHLAGAGVADKRWTKERKREILESRVQSTRLLYRFLSRRTHQVRKFISASAIGIYGFGLRNEVLAENSKHGDDFLSQVVTAWENEVNAMPSLGVRTIILRIGIVLSKEGGALKEMARPVRWGVGAPLGTGNQYLSWIHIDDLCRMFLFALENESIAGVYNAAGVQPVTNREFTRTVAAVLKKPMWLPPVPAFVLKLLLGEMAGMVLNGSRVSSEKIQRAGFTFRFTDLHSALLDLLT
ncbi:MAG: TIGR01777 family oxidoreductase [Cyclobacteriaceae bacterium]|nr:TIGR01777 family oxidoreductase [Cyclobacteriaceae bacterium]